MVKVGTLRGKKNQLKKQKEWHLLPFFQLEKTKRQNPKPRYSLY
jgi:hypothetical protein